MYRSIGHEKFPKFQCKPEFLLNGKRPGTQPKESGIVLVTGIRNPSSTDEEHKIHYLHFNQERKHLFLILRIF